MKANVLTHKSDLSAIPELLRDKFGPNSVKLEGTDEDWTSLVVTKRRAFGKSTLRLNALRPGTQLDEIKQGLRHVFSIEAYGTACAHRLEVNTVSNCFRNLL